jgi:uncharacterized membrane protein
MGNSHRDEPLKLSPYYLFCCSNPLCGKVVLYTGTAAVSFLILVIIVGVILKYAILQLHPAINFVLLFFGLVLLAYVERLNCAVIAVENGI